MTLRGQRAPCRGHLDKRGLTQRDVRVRGAKLRWLACGGVSATGASSCCRPFSFVLRPPLHLKHWTSLFSARGDKERPETEKKKRSKCGSDVDYSQQYKWMVFCTDETQKWFACKSWSLSQRPSECLETMNSLFSLNVYQYV